MRNIAQRKSPPAKPELTLISTHRLLSFILTCNPKCSTIGVYIATQSLFSGDNRCAGTGILLNSFLSTPFEVARAKGANPDDVEVDATGAVLEVDAVALSIKISPSSSSTCCGSGTVDVGAVVDVGSSTSIDPEEASADAVVDALTFLGTLAFFGLSSLVIKEIAGRSSN